MATLSSSMTSTLFTVGKAQASLSMWAKSPNTLSIGLSHRKLFLILINEISPCLGHLVVFAPPFLDLEIFGNDIGCDRSLCNRLSDALLGQIRCVFTPLDDTPIHIFARNIFPSGVVELSGYHLPDQSGMKTVRGLGRIKHGGSAGNEGKLFRHPSPPNIGYPSDLPPLY